MRNHKISFMMLAMVAFFLSLSKNVYAYIDPTTLGAIYQAGYFLFYSFVAVLLFFYRPMKVFVLRIFGKSKGTAESEKQPDEKHKE